MTKCVTIKGLKFNEFISLKLKNEYEQKALTCLIQEMSSALVINFVTGFENRVKLTLISYNDTCKEK